MNQESKIAILGYGIEGKSVLDYLVKHNYENITICDANVDMKEKMPDGISVRLGKDYLNDLQDFDVIFRSPGVKYLEPQIQLAVEMGKEVTSCIGFYMEQCSCPVVGITGTKGKGTTSTLIHMMLERGKKKSHLGGNIGEAPIKFLKKQKADDVVVLELSSFQLQDIRKSPRYAVMLNTTADHLDYHKDREEYMEAKENVLAHQGKDGVAVLNKDYEYVEYYMPLVKGTLRLVSVREKVKDGAYEDDGMIYHCVDGEAEEIMKTSDIKLIGSHNIENVLPAIVIAKEFGVKTKDIVKIVKEFKGLPHRLEFVKEASGVRYYNDSFSTTTETSMAAVDSFEEPTVLIAGGHDKGLDYGEWALKILTKPNLKTVILIGDTADKMEHEIVEAEEKLGDAQGSATQVLRRQDLSEAVLTAYSEVEKGGVVVMSPAAASFGLFENYKERGKEFVNLVKKLR